MSLFAITTAVIKPNLPQIKVYKNKTKYLTTKITVYYLYRKISKLLSICLLSKLLFTKYWSKNFREIIIFRENRIYLNNFKIINIIIIFHMLVYI